ncbi:MAG: HAMP domain-containing sensor histidine kinase [Lachnospiraceae bacterium]|nr:HAMP domain-containing sensor histidine kinase [Lachnospiraceae bacterium]
MKYKSEKYRIYLFSGMAGLLSMIIAMFGVIGIQRAYLRQITGIFGTFSMEQGQIPGQQQMDQLMDGRVSQAAIKSGQQLLRKYGYEQSGPELLRSQIGSSMGILFAGVMLLALFLIGGIAIQYRRECRFYEWLTLNIAYPEEAESKGAAYREAMRNNTETSEPKKKKIHYATRERRELLLTLKQHQKDDARKELLMVQEKKRMSDWVEDIAHQLKTPLSVLSIQLERLGDKKVYEERRVKKAAHQTEKMIYLIMLLMKMGRLSTSTHHMEIKKHDVQKLMQKVEEETGSICSDRQVKLNCSVEGGSYFYYDEEWMTEAVSNLVKNSAEHSESGQQIEVQFLVLSTSMRITVRDHGCGIEEGKLTAIFERYISSGRQTDNGSGIGLSIAKGVVDHHFGKISAQNEPEGGVTFTILLPLFSGSAVYIKKEGETDGNT